MRTKKSSLHVYRIPGGPERLQEICGDVERVNSVPVDTLAESLSEFKISFLLLESLTSAEEAFRWELSSPSSTRHQHSRRRPEGPNSGGKGRGRGSKHTLT